MNIIVRVKQMLKKNKGCFEYWDASATVNWPDLLKEKISGNNDVIVVITEGTMHELSGLRHSIKKAREVYWFIKNVKSSKLIIEVTDDKTRSWTIDEQVVNAVYKAYKKGYDVRLVTCDQDQAYKAEIKKLKYTLLRGARYPQVEKQPKGNIQKSSDKPKSNQPTILPTEIKEEITVPYKKVGKENYIDVKTRISVYDSRGRRKIGRANMISIQLTDTFVYKNITYRIKNMEQNILTLKKQNST